MRPFHIVNAFTTRAFCGNPAAVLVLDDAAWPRDAWMQSVAAQFNLSETAFALKAPEGAWALRWMTPRAEVDLCGHATLGAAHVLWRTQRLGSEDKALFDTQSGRLTCSLRPDGRIAMDFPALGVEAIPAPDEALEALGVHLAVASTDGTYLLLEMRNEEDLKAVQPDFEALSNLREWGVILTARASGEGDFVSRFFAPRKGVPEDPVTGSAHCRLAPYWAAKLGKTALEARQLSERGGEVGMELEGDRVTLLGKALTVASGELLV